MRSGMLNKTGYISASVHPPANRMTALTTSPIKVKSIPKTNSKRESHLCLLIPATT